MDEKLRKLQLTQLEILEYVDKFCKGNDIKYSLYAGTLLGAVRHKGFIPWDDDLDIIMPRDDYDRFIELWCKEKHEMYFLQNKDNEPNFTQSFTKIRKKKTNFYQQDDLGRDYHTGIFIDVFPIDRIPNGKSNKKLFKLYCMIYQLMTREFIPKKSNTIVKLVSKTLLRITNVSSRVKIRNYFLDKIKSNNANNSLNMVTIEVMRCLNIEYPSNLFDNLCELEFENRKFSCVSQWDRALKVFYGDYMQLPPEEERMWRHKPLIIDFENSPKGYEDDIYA